MNKDLVRGYLHAQCLGKGKAVPSQALEQALNLSGNSLRKQVNRLRREGVPIASCSRGYFYAETEEELQRTIRQLQSRIKKIAYAERGLIKAWREQFNNSGQITFPLEGGDTD